MDSKNEDTQYTILIPTRNSGRWLAHFIQQYRRLSVSPMFLLDDRSSDNTEHILIESGARYRKVRLEYDRVESMLALAEEYVEAEWTLRLDDDELPSRRLLQWLSASVESIDEDALWVSRREAFFHNDTFVYSRLEDYYHHPDDPTFLGPQLRLYRHRKVEYSSAIHTPGIVAQRTGFVPQEAYAVHFDWLVRTFEERKEKLRRYEIQQPGAGWGFASFYFPELHRASDSRWTPFNLEEFEEFARTINACE